MSRDPFRDATCRTEAADPRWWDEDASTDEQALAAELCRSCPALAACVEAVVAAGPAASGTWAGQWRPWTDPLTVDDHDVHAYRVDLGAQSTVDEGQMSFEELIG